MSESLSVFKPKGGGNGPYKFSVRAAYLAKLNNLVQSRIIDKFFCFAIPCIPRYRKMRLYMPVIYSHCEHCRYDLLFSSVLHSPLFV